MEASNPIETETEFWTELEELLKENRSAFLSDIDHALTSFVNLAAQHYGKLLLPLGCRHGMLRLLARQASILRQKQS